MCRNQLHHLAHIFDRHLQMLVMLKVQTKTTPACTPGSSTVADYSLAFLDSSQRAVQMARLF